MFRSVLLLTVLAGASALAQADVYRWVDAQGRIQYSDKWVPGSELVKMSNARPNPQATEARRSAEQGKLAASNGRIAEQQAENANAQAVKQDVAKVRQDQCVQDKDRYDKAVHARRIFRTAPDGTRTYVSDADADAYREKARADMVASCGSAAK